MDSATASSSDSSASPTRRRYRPRRPDLLSARISRSFTHPLRLLHRAGGSFFVLGSTSNVYTVTLFPARCSCPDERAPLSLCKHALFVLLRVLRLPLHRLHLPLPRSVLLSPTAPGVLASPRARERFHQLFSAPRNAKWVGATCPVCLDEMRAGVAECAACGNGVHESCLGRWRKARGRRGLTCVMCRARWRARDEAHRSGDAAEYVNLSGYDDAAAGAAAGAGVG